MRNVKNVNAARAVKASTVKASEEAKAARENKQKLIVHAGERVAVRFLETLEVAIASNQVIELAVIEKLDGDQILAREKQNFSFAERIYSDMKEMLLVMNGFSFDDEEAEESEEEEEEKFRYGA
jgi:hypothetical protein